MLSANIAKKLFRLIPNRAHTAVEHLWRKNEYVTIAVQQQKIILIIAIIAERVWVHMKNP